MVSELAETIELSTYGGIIYIPWLVYIWYRILEVLDDT